MASAWTTFKAGALAFDSIFQVLFPLFFHALGFFVVSGFLILVYFSLQSYSRGHPSFFGSAKVERRLVDDVKRLSAELAAARGALEFERKGRANSESALRAQVAEVEELKETALQSLRDSVSSKEILKKELDGNHSSLFCSLLSLLRFCFLTRLLDSASSSKGEEEPYGGSLVSEECRPDRAQSGRRGNHSR